MANSLLDVLTGVGDRLRTIPRLDVRDVIPNRFNVEWAMALVYPRPTDQFVAYSVLAGGEIHVWEIAVRVLTGRVSDIEAQKRLFLLFSTDTEYSIVNAIKADRTLGGVASKTIIRGGFNFGEITLLDGRAYQVGDLYIAVTAGPSSAA